MNTACLECEMCSNQDISLCVEILLLDASMLKP